MKNNYGIIKFQFSNKTIDSKKIFLGVMIGDFTRTGISTMINSGSNFGLGSNIFGSGFQDKYIKSQEYTKTNTKFSFVTSTLSLVVSLIFILGGFYNTVDLYVRSVGYGEVATGIMFFGALFLITDILSLPFSLYSTFIIEEKYGFNKA